MMNVISNEESVEDVVNTFQHPFKRTMLRIHAVVLVVANACATPFVWVLEQLDGTEMCRDFLNTKD